MLAISFPIWENTPEDDGTRGLEQHFLFMPVETGRILLLEENQRNYRDHHRRTPDDLEVVTIEGDAKSEVCRDAWNVSSTRGGYVHSARQPRVGSVYPSIPTAVASQQGWEVHDLCFP